MEQQGIFASFSKWFVTCLYFAWIVTAITAIGAMVGLLINLAINKDVFIPIITISATAFGFIVGILAAEHRRRSDFL